MAASSKRSTSSDGQVDEQVLKKVKKVPSKWSEEEERVFLEIVNMVVKSGVWPTAKQNGLLAHRGSVGVQKHWDAMYKKRKAGK